MKQFLPACAANSSVAPARKKPVLVADLKKILGDLPDSLLGKRDRALLLLGFTGALRRSDIGLNAADLEQAREGLIVSISAGARTDQEGEGRKMGIPPGPRSGHLSDSGARGVARCCRHRVRRPVFRVMNRHGQVLLIRLSGEGVAIMVNGTSKSSATIRPCFPATVSAPDSQHLPRGGKRRARHHEPDRPSQRDHSAPLHPGRQPIPGKRRGRNRALSQEQPSTNVTASAIPSGCGDRLPVCFEEQFIPAIRSRSWKHDQVGERQKVGGQAALRSGSRLWLRPEFRVPAPEYVVQFVIEDLRPRL